MFFVRCEAHGGDRCVAHLVDHVLPSLLVRSSFRVGTLRRVIDPCGLYLTPYYALSDAVAFSVVELLDPGIELVLSDQHRCFAQKPRKICVLHHEAAILPIPEVVIIVVRDKHLGLELLENAQVSVGVTSVPGWYRKEQDVYGPFWNRAWSPTP